MKKVILVTGASSGIGKATALLLLQRGYTIYAAARRTEAMLDLQHAGAQLLSMDVTDDDSMQSGIAEILQKEKQLDVLINNAGYGSYGALEDVPLSEARHQFEVNVFGLARLTQLVLPGMRARKSGLIINISSIGGKIAVPHGSWYHASKFALEGLSDCLRMELRQFGIRVVIVEPGAIQTAWNGIARENLQKVSGQTAYSALAARHVKMLAKGDERFGSKPSVIAETIEKAILSRNPKTRYAAGGGARLLLFIKKIMPDKMFDSLLMSQLK
jgi:NAD(P)-dependent dehydrogenase (short-subunit alcohol dehydrogenase family)